jgi:hypothetical protein
VEQRVKNRGRAGGWYSVAAHAAASSLLLSTLFTGHGGRRRRASPIMSSLSCAPVQYTPLVTSWHTAHYCNLQVSGRRVRSAGRSQASYHTSKIPARPYTSGQWLAAVASCTAAASCATHSRRGGSGTGTPPGGAGDHIMSSCCCSPMPLAFLRVQCCW